MRISVSDRFMTIDFEKENSPWALLVIDDHWDIVKFGVCGAISQYGNNNFLGLHDKCVSKDDILIFWDRFYQKSDTYERTLLLLPWMVFDAEGFGSITFCGFPDDVEQLKAILQSNLCHLFQWAVLLDVWHETGYDVHKERFVSTFRLLEQFGIYEYQCAKFSRGGAPLPDWTSTFHYINKEYGDKHEKQKNYLLKWLSEIRGVINSNRFHELTDDICHNPTDLLNEVKCSAAKRKIILKELSNPNNDLYGVWRWCAIEASQDTLNDSALHRWLACKAFQKWRTDLKIVPLTSVIAICEGACYCANRGNWKYDVISDLYDIPMPSKLHTDSEVFKINKIKVLGCIRIEKHNYGEFALVLRNWLIHEEQFLNGCVYLQSVSIQCNKEIGQVKLEMNYSGLFPRAVTNYSKGESQEETDGQVIRDWQNLCSFALSYEHNAEKLVLKFSFVDR